MEIQDIKNQTNIVDVIGRYVALKKRGNELYGTCPFHDDHKASLQVSELKQIFKCFACGEGGDVFDFLKAQGKTIQEAKDEILGATIDMKAIVKKNTHKKTTKIWKQVVPVPFDAPLEFITSKRIEIKGQWVQLKYVSHWTYRNEKGETVGYTVRFHDAEGNKNVYPLSYCTDGTQSKWMWQGFDLPRMLYNLDIIAKYPQSTILLVEGEKTADAAQAQFDPSKVVVTTWLGGANSITNTDWTPIQNRKVIMFPDNDLQGLSAMLHIRHVAGFRASKILPLDATLPAHWDCADKQWNDGELRDFVLGRMVDDIPCNNNGGWKFKQIGSDTVYEFGIEKDNWFFKKSKKVEPPPFIDDEHDNLPPEYFNAPDDAPDYSVPESWFRFLGYEKNESGTQAFFFYVFRSNQIIRLSPTAMSQSNLLLLAPLGWWEDMFAGGKSSKINTDAASNFLIERSIQVGIFNPENVRGRGAWMDGKHVVIHCGSHLIVDGVRTPFNAFKSRYIYEAGYDLGFELSNPLNAGEGKKLLDLCSLINWERPINAYFLAGWCVIAPVCGALKWRPHIWITGAAGTGKSWLFEKIVRRLLGQTALAVQSATTEAGIRQYLGQDAMPVTFDEAEGEDRQAQERMQSVLTLMRGASTSDGGMIIKGSAAGSATRYSIRSCFAYASIGVALNQQSDRSRVTVLSVSKLQGEEGHTRWEKIQRAYSDTISDEYSLRIQSRTISLLPVLIKNAETFSNAAAVVLGDQRAGDQVGTLLAGAYSLISTKQISFDEALDWIKAKDWTEEKSSEHNKDEIRLITHLMEKIARIDIDGRFIEKTVGELVFIARGIAEAEILAETAQRKLLTLGYRIDSINKTLLVSNTAEFVKASLKDTPWANNHPTILRRLKGAEPKDQTTFGSFMKSRAVEIPLSTIFD